MKETIETVDPLVPMYDELVSHRPERKLEKLPVVVDSTGTRLREWDIVRVLHYYGRRRGRGREKHYMYKIAKLHRRLHDGALEMRLHHSAASMHGPSDSYIPEDGTFTIIDSPIGDGLAARRNTIAYGVPPPPPSGSSPKAYSIQMLLRAVVRELDMYVAGEPPATVTRSLPDLCRQMLRALEEFISNASACQTEGVAYGWREPIWAPQLLEQGTHDVLLWTGGRGVEYGYVTLYADYVEWGSRVSGAIPPPTLFAPIRKPIITETSDNPKETIA